MVFKYLKAFSPVQAFIKNGMYLFHKVMQAGYPPALIFFLIIHFVVWLCVPLLRLNIPMDSAEAIVWGSEGTFGTNKHPFLAGWIAYAFFKILSWPDLSVYVLSQVCVLIGLIYIFKIARFFLNQNEAVLSALFLEGTLYYSLCSTEFNVNVLSIAVVPAGVYYFYKALFEKESEKYWFLTGIFAGIMLLTKYTNIIFLVSMGVYLLLSTLGRRCFQKSGIYVAGITALIILIPHILFLFQHDFYVLSYFFNRVDRIEHIGILAHFWHPFVFLVSQILASLGTIILFLILAKKEATRRPVTLTDKTLFLIIMGSVPLILLLLISFLSGAAFKSMWGFATLYLMPTLLFFFFRIPLPSKRMRQGFYLTYIIMGLFALAGIWYAWGHISSKAHFPGREISRQMYRVWAKTYDAPLLFVGGDIWLASNLAVYTNNPVHVLIDMNAQTAPWIDMDALRKAGLLAVAPDESTYKTYQHLWPELSEPLVWTYTLKNKMGFQKENNFYYGFLAPLTGKGDQ